MITVTDLVIVGFACILFGGWLLWLAYSPAFREQLTDKEIERVTEEWKGK